MKIEMIGVVFLAIYLAPSLSWANSRRKVIFKGVIFAILISRRGSLSFACFGRSILDGPVSTHVTTTREEVLTMKPYVDGVLAELLQGHHDV
jgi:hypothetical protein